MNTTNVNKKKVLLTLTLMVLPSTMLYNYWLDTESARKLVFKLDLPQYLSKEELLKILREDAQELRMGSIKQIWGRLLDTRKYDPLRKPPTLGEFAMSLYKLEKEMLQNHILKELHSGVSRKDSIFRPKSNMELLEELSELSEEDRAERLHQYDMVHEVLQELELQ